MSYLPWLSLSVRMRREGLMTPLLATSPLLILPIVYRFHSIEREFIEHDDARPHASLLPTAREKVRLAGRLRYQRQPGT